MSDILFRCPKCQCSFAIDEAEAGQDTTCSSCGNCTTVPIPEIQMRCASCQIKLATSNRNRGETFDCPNCEKPVLVPKLSLKTREDVVSPSLQPVQPSVIAQMASFAPSRSHSFAIPGWLKSVILIGIAAVVIFLIVRPIPKQPVDQDPNSESDYKMLKCGLMALYSIDQLGKGNVTGGFSGLQYTQRQFSDSEFSSFLSTSNYMVACTQCKGAGEVRTPCPACIGAGKCAYCKTTGKCPKCEGGGKGSLQCAVCNGSSKCGQCAGTGKIASYKEVTKRVAVAGLAGNSSVKSMGNMTRPVTTREKIEVPCPECHQTGKCEKCNGAGKSMVQCSLCSGRGQCKRCQGSGNCVKCAGVGSSGQKCSECSATGLVVSKERIQQNRDQVLTHIQTLVGNRQTHEPRSPTVQDLADSLRRMDISNALTKVDSGDLFFFGTFNRTDQSAKTNVTEEAVADYSVDTARISLFDGLIRQSYDAKIDLSIDPDALQSLAEKLVDRSEMAALTTINQVQNYLSQRGLNAEPTSLFAKQRVLFVTTPSILMYCTSCNYLEKGDLRSANAAINESRADSGKYGQQCRALKSVITVMIEQRKEIEKLQHDIEEDLRKYTSAVKAAQMASHSVGLKSSNDRVIGLGDNTDVQRATLDARVNEAERSLNSLAASGRKFLSGIGAANGTLWTRFQDAYRLQLNTECVVLLNHLINNFAIIRKLSDQLLAADLKLDWDLGTVPDEILAYQKIVNTEHGIAQAQLTECASPSANLTAKMMSDKMDEAFTANRASQEARVGSGYFNSKRHTAAIKSLLTTDVLDPDRQAAIKQELRTNMKFGLLAAFQAINGEATSGISTDNRLGNTVAGLVVCAGHGEMFPISVRVENAVYRTVLKRTVVQNYWETVYSTTEDLLASEPVTFGDYAEKDFLMKVSAIEALKWLRFKYPKEMTGKGIHLEFHDLFSPKGGDSAGAAMAISAYSSLTNIPIRKSVAMTGSIRSDGSILPVGGIVQKVSACASGSGIELVLVPKANEPDLIAISLDDLCRVAIVTADDMETYVQYAMRADYKQQAMENLQRAQALILLGRRDEAVKLLKPLAARNQELYTARRLLDLLSIYGSKP